LSKILVKYFLENETGRVTGREKEIERKWRNKERCREE